MNVVRRVIDSVLAPTKGKAFFAVCAAIAVGLYLAGLTDGRPNPAGATALTGPPVIKAALIDVSPSGTARVDPAALRPVVTPAIPADRPTLVRRLQTALARAGCYGGPITGVWSEPSKSAMGRFVVVANAQLPVSEPDPALLALVETTNSASCGSAAITTGAIPAPQPVPVLVADRSEQGSIPATVKTAAAKEEPASDDAPPMIERSWAPAEMLTMPKEQTPPAGASASPAAGNIIIGSSTPDRDDEPPHAVTAPPAKIETSAIASPSPDRIDAAAKPDYPLPVSQQKVEIQPDPTAPPDPRDEDRDAKPKKDKAKNEKTKTAKRKAKPSQPPSFSEGLDQLQRSVSNFFN